MPCRVDGEVLWRADGSAFPAEYSSYPILDDGQVCGAVVTFVDISERKQAEELLRRTNDALETRVAERTAELSAALAQLRELANHLESVRETERKRIAREVHDELGSLLVALKMDVDWLGDNETLYSGACNDVLRGGYFNTTADNAAPLADRPELQCKCHGMGRLIDTAVDNVGRIITDLRPSILDHQGLWAALEWQAQEFIEAAELRSDLQLHVAAGVAPPEGGVAIAVFRIFQEILSNIARHAQATHVHIRITVDDPPEPVLYLDVRDDGIGAPPQALADARSYGVLGMRERAAHFGGRLVIDSAPGQGTRVRLVMPLGTEASP